MRIRSPTHTQPIGKALAIGGRPGFDYLHVRPTAQPCANAATVTIGLASLTTVSREFALARPTRTKRRPTGERASVSEQPRRHNAPGKRYPRRGARDLPAWTSPRPSRRATSRRAGRSVVLPPAASQKRRATPAAVLPPAKGGTRGTGQSAAPVRAPQVKAWVSGGAVVRADVYAGTSPRGSAPAVRMRVFVRMGVRLAQAAPRELVRGRQTSRGSVSGKETESL